MATGTRDVNEIAIYMPQPAGSLHHAIVTILSHAGAVFLLHLVQPIRPGL